MTTMDEFDLARHVFGDPEEDAHARERLRGLMLDAIVGEPVRIAARRRRRWRATVAALAAALSLGLIATLVLPSANAAAAAELRRLGQLSSTRDGPEIGPGQYVLTRSDELRPEGNTFLGSGVTFTVVSRLRISTWVAADGSGFRRTEVISSDFASPEDARAWEAAGRPDILPAAGDVRKETYAAEEAPWLDASDLPTDPDRLLEALRSGAVVPRSPGDDQVFLLIGDVLALGDAPAGLRSALFEVAAKLDGVRLVGTVDDPLARSGVAIYVDGTNARTQLIFDPETAQLLAIEDFPILPDGSRGSLRSWIALHATTVVDSPPPF
jgi:hypothetical protein